CYGFAKWSVRIEQELFPVQSLFKNSTKQQVPAVFVFDDSNVLGNNCCYFLESLFDTHDAGGFDSHICASDAVR
ncbi:hypothetical protein A2U01_0007616, partial [Trifolium medium]|nr:hypothetical protein [Trifolium medium]